MGKWFNELSVAVVAGLILLAVPWALKYALTLRAARSEPEGDVAAEQTGQKKPWRVIFKEIGWTIPPIMVMGICGFIGFVVLSVGIIAGIETNNLSPWIGWPLLVVEIGLASLSSPAMHKLSNLPIKRSDWIGAAGATLLWSILFYVMHRYIK